MALPTDEPDAVIDILDATNLDRNLYLAVQIMELGSPLVLALNMADLAAQHGIEFNLELMRKLLGVRIVPTVGSKGKGLQELLCAAIETARERPCSGMPVPAWMPLRSAGWRSSSSKATRTCARGLTFRR